jgi:hypothetical protein
VELNLGTEGIQGVGFDLTKIRYQKSEDTEGTHLRPGIWVDILVPFVKADGLSGGRLFQRVLTSSTLSEFVHDFFTLIERGVQSLTDFIDKDTNGREACGVLRSLRRGFTAHAKNMELPGEWIDMMNRWRRAEANSRTGAPHLDMSDVYAPLESITQWF